MQNTLPNSHQAQLSKLVVVDWCEKCDIFLPVESRSGWSGQFWVTDVPAGVSLQHNKPSHMRPQYIPREENAKINVMTQTHTHFLCLQLCSCKVIARVAFLKMFITPDSQTPTLLILSYHLITSELWRSPTGNQFGRLTGSVLMMIFVGQLETFVLTLADGLALSLSRALSWSERWVWDRLSACSSPALWRQERTTQVRRCRQHA